MINRFDGKYDFLSNFYNCEIEYEGVKYPSVEHAFQAAKISIPGNPEVTKIMRQKIAKLPTPKQSKAAGMRVDLRKDWEEVKLKIMEDLIRIKFTTHEDLKQKLINTGNVELIEGNWWKDTYWGICNGIGQNNLGKTLMKVRRDIKLYL